MKQFRFYEVEINEIEPRIISLDYGNYLVTADIVRSLLLKIKKDWPGQKVALLSAAEAISNLDKVAYVLEELKASEFICAGGILVRNRLQADIAQAFVKIQVAGAYAQKIFVDKEEALVWLRERLGD
ncbi:phosphoribosylamine--glycine ligase [Tepidicaulis marinus]|uniref:Phosphoribosylamine--glycine ligase n=1 Tax=Tepidicaulis marinus TaxID=1333998 RepID=A0A081B8B4_9HYPH|nr:hypothetical protein [Tepidicaulis marinus]GAK44282.1 phosphoribosylamine--glycine ligase [Tepidicaulis marinus]